jgi:histidyl-tRNA synthetase
VDGAFDRRSYATPLISDAMILSTGASVSESMEEVIALTTHTVKLLTIKQEENQKILKLSEDIIKNSKLGIIGSDNSVKLLNVLTALDAAKDIAENLEEDSKYIVIKGAVTSKLLEDLMRITNEYKGKTFLVEDGTKLFLSKNTIGKFEKKGGILKVLNPITIAAVTINPTSPYGYEFEENEFLNLLKKELTIPVFNLGPSD